MTDLLRAATAAYARSLAEAPEDPQARARLLARVRQSRRRRYLGWTLALPLGASLLGSAAWAAAGGALPQPLSQLVAALGWQHEVAAPEVPTTSPRATGNAPVRRDGVPQAVAPVAEEAAAPVVSVAEERRSVGLAEFPGESTPVVPSVMPRPAARREVEGRAAESTAPTAPPAISDGAAAKGSGDDLRDLSGSFAGATDHELELYERAHRLHFREHEPAAALAAWDEYLREAPHGRLAVEARYNRALCLLRLGRNDEARKALEPFATGNYGAYRQEAAKRLLDGLPSAPAPSARP